MTEYEERQIERTATLSQLIWCLIKCLVTHGNKKIVTTSCQRCESLDLKVYKDDETGVLIIEGS